MSTRVPQRILVAPSGFKESLCAESVASAIASGVRRALPGVRVDTAPIADGGEGTARTLAAATRGTVHETTVVGPVGEPVPSHWARLGGSERSVAVVEMAAAAGLSLVPHDRRDPGATTTYGVGQLMAAALDAGADTILVGCGDSGTCDGGAGALQALGARILDVQGHEIGRGGRELIRAHHLDLTALHPRLTEVDVVLACNPHNVLCGPSGVARVFGPQKGASPDQVDELAAALDNWARVLEQDGVATGDVATGAGTGASGGLGAGLAAGVGAQLRSRFDALLDSGLSGIDLDRRIRKADLVITAEGSIDFQTPRGKVPAEVARRCQQFGVPVIALAGSLGRGAPAVHDVGIAAIASIITVPMPLSEAVANGERLLTDAAERTMRMILLGGAVSARSGNRSRKKSA
ncbi:MULTISPECIES: glycerate kinase [unclassified Rhodococcus (in: high G+C Gram-positive bacteria)]|uniref:glycerate kinase family protein n=1 Tax=unclassified Rhodococcus (in: high G+C Gram-positive bacteria) TaxID=192944 RepID=UPI0006F53C92|nr:MULTISPECIES: glycerate kinase [unclassified Rhodococcus (in: high G+C Gram-positive bacteria)]KQU34456.1 glycerate kinase [Rhodococcus sp. Leaf225]KQU45218.1 glycerate kinase [Rhodococcus sp. Leaf258]